MGRARWTWTFCFWEILKSIEPGLAIPHPRLAERAFVLTPLNEIAAEVVVPGHGLTVGQLLARWFLGQKGESDAVLRFPGDAWLAR